MEQTQLQQLRHLLLQQLRKPPAHVAPAVLRQLCLALADLVALLPAWADVITTAHTQLPQWHCIELLHSIAEEGSSDWRHVNVPGLSSSQHVDWATATRERFRGWSNAALQLLLTWLQQQQQQQQQQAKLLACLAAWVRLGCLHQVPLQLAEQVAQAGLLGVQSSNEQQLLQPLDAAGGSLREALLHLSVLPQVHEGQLLCLPALEVWGGLLDPEVGPCASSSSNSASAAAGGAAAAAGKVLLERAHSEGDSAAISSPVGASGSGAAGASAAAAAADEDAEVASQQQQQQQQQQQNPAQAWSKRDSKGTEQLALLLSTAAASLQQPAADGTLPAQQRHLVLNFCLAIKGWASLLVQLFTSRAAAGDASHMPGLLQLLLHLAAHSEEAQAAAAAAVRAVCSAAFKAGWPELHHIAPLLMQVVQSAGCSGPAEQDLLASLSGCLAAPGASEQQLQQLRAAAAEQLLQPGIAYLQELQQQLQSGATWAALESSADPLGSGVLLDSGLHIMQALQELWCVGAIAALMQPGAGDAAPDLAEPLLKLYACFAKHGRRLHANNATLVAKHSTVDRSSRLAGKGTSGAARKV
ncbi:hypothetical protein OEZ85_006663 [Tetradesmus obliquus]|uniref:Exportin-1/Importin-beta-like domain-containing protein n=1 Tax=Tetradesmus obliquus TaxID=3088 RepID=A0ABY8TVB2_TETOB|nr:hypothetical protein OEZ85_006663 [Tetradesmus obliquus]